LLGKVLATVMKGGSRKRRKRKNNELMGSLLEGLASGKWLITTIGPGVGCTVPASC